MDYINSTEAFSIYFQSNSALELLDSIRSKNYFSNEQLDNVLQMYKSAMLGASDKSNTSVFLSIPFKVYFALMQSAGIVNGDINVLKERENALWRLAISDEIDNESLDVLVNDFTLLAKESKKYHDVLQYAI